MGSEDDGLKRKLASFRQQAAPLWTSRSVDYLYHQSNNANIGTLFSLASDVGGSIHPQGMDTIPASLVGPKVYQNGRTNAQISTSQNSFNVYQGGSTNAVVLLPNQQDKVIKKNPTGMEDELEYKLYLGFKERDLPVPSR